MTAARTPAWLGLSAVPGRLREMHLASRLAKPTTVQVWTPSGTAPSDPTPLLWCFDGPEFIERADLLQWAGAHIESGALPPFRIAAHVPYRRTQLYSGSDLFQRSLGLALDELRTQVPVRGPVAIMGASLGGLTALLVALRRPDVGAVLSQSGSFFRVGDEPGFVWEARVARRVRAIPRLAQGRPDLLIGMTCGRREGNFRANQELAGALRSVGSNVTWRPVAGLHTWDAWRASLNPIWPDLLERAWSTQG